MTPTSAELRPFIMEFFSDEELESLCFDYFREPYQNFTTGMTKNRKAMLLVSYCETRGRLADLTAALERERPAAWRDKFGAPPVETGRRPVSTPIAPIRDPRQVFISHATADAEFAHQLADDLRAEGWRIWIAPESIRPGEKWVEAIERGLETSGVFVVALTPAAVASKWVKTETNAAIDLHQQDEIRFLSLDVAECRLTALWRQFQYITFRRSYETGLRELLRWLEGGYPLPGTAEQGEGVVRLPPRPTTRTEKRVKEEQWRQLQALAYEIAAELGRQSGDDELRAVYKRFNREFGLTTYKKLPRRWFPEGLSFLTAWRDDIVTSTVSGEPDPHSVRIEVTSHANVDKHVDRLKSLPDKLSPPINSQYLPNIYIHEKTGIEFVHVPAGPFIYGEGETQRMIELPEFWISRAPVTNAQYRRFIDATHHLSNSYWRAVKHPESKSNDPVVYVNWIDAKSFCEWAGVSLPTEEQWEKAARGADGRAYPWGDDPPTVAHCNFARNLNDTTPVGTFSPKGDSPYGCIDMAGNVWEWTDPPYEQADRFYGILKGGSWVNHPKDCKCMLRNTISLYEGSANIGFRVLAEQALW
jgi:formylglycine-generating enzyme required for sulfatase activity